MQDSGTQQHSQGTWTGTVTMALAPRWPWHHGGPHRGSCPPGQPCGAAWLPKAGSGPRLRRGAAKPRGTVGHKQPLSTLQLCFGLKSNPREGREGMSFVPFASR